MKKSNYIWVAALLIATICILARRNSGVYQSDNGLIFGTIYNITYRYPDNLKKEIEAELKRFDNSLSPFNDSSVISRVNRNEEIDVDTLFRNCFNKAIEVSQMTNGAFDITIAPLANAWGFGFKHGDFSDTLTIDSLLQITGYDKVTLADGKVRKQDDRIQLSCSAIAKGYAVDVIASFLERKGIKDFLVDIGGEIVAKGRNPKDGLWRIGVNKPIDDSLSVNQEIQAVLQLTNVGMATSGNYRNFYYKDGKKYAHTIDPRTGYPVQHSLLSATVIAEDCMTADALATSFMVMGLEDAEKFVNAHPTVEAYFIYSDSTGENKTYFTKGMEKFIAR
jgi:thiamine biosynthesis lipoprotein